MYVAFVDFRGAFDSIVHAILWRKLYKAGMSTQLIRVLQNYYTKACTRVRTEKGKTDIIDITKGVFQGELIISQLFILLLFDIADYFIEDREWEVIRDIKLMLFADDLVLLGTDIIDLQHQLDTLSKYSYENQL